VDDKTRWTGNDGATNAVDQAVVRSLQARVAELLDQRKRALRAAGQALLGEDEQQLAQELVAEVVEQHTIDLLDSGRPAPAPDVEVELISALFARLFGAGRLQPLLDDPDIEDILVNGCDEVFVIYADGRKERGPAVADSDEELVELVQTLGSYAGLNPRPFDAANPELDLRLPDGSRLSATQRFSERPTVAIRRNRFEQVFLADLVANGTLSREVAQLLTAGVLARKNMLIAGETGAGKTTLLRALINAIPADERLVIVENSRELNIRSHPELHPDVVEFEAVLPNSEGVGEVGLDRLVRRSLRMNPDRVIVGEVLGAEIVSMMQAMSQGNDGSLCTIHAATARGVFNRVLLYSRSAPERPDFDTVHLLMSESLDFVVFLRKTRDPVIGGSRRPDRDSRRMVSEILEINGWDGARVQASEIFVPGVDGRAVRDPDVHVMHTDDLAEAGWDPDGRGPMSLDGFTSTRRLDGGSG
jgi:Flp pilus assembly CpaF family ATPase